MAYSINFNDAELTDYIRVVTVRRNIGTSRTNNTVKSGNRAGQLFTGTTRDMATIEIDYKMKNNLIGKRRELAAVLDVAEPTVLLLGDEPDKYYNALPDGDFALTEQNFLGTGTLRFIVPDGLAHATGTKQFNFADDVTTVENLGTAKAPLNIHILFNSDANSVGVVSEDQVVQLGSDYSEDEDDFVASNRVIRDGMDSEQKAEWKTNVGRPRFKYDYGDGSSRIMGTFTWGNSKVSVTSYGTVKDGDPSYWHGPTLTRSLPTALDNFSVYHRFKLKPGGARKDRAKSQALFELNYMDADNNFVMGFGLKDNNPNKAEMMYDFFIGDYLMYRGYLPKKVLKYTEGIFGYIEMTKVGNEFSFKLCHLYNGRENWSVKKTYHNDSVAMLSATTIDVFAAQWKKVRSMEAELTSTTVTKLNTEDESLVPLTFYEGDDVFMDGSTNQVYINGIRNDDYRVIGSSQFLVAPKGETEFSVVTDGTYEGFLEERECYV